MTLDPLEVTMVKGHFMFCSRKGAFLLCFWGIMAHSTVRYLVRYTKMPYGHLFFREKH